MATRFEHVFVGRQREMTDLRAALDDVLHGTGRLVMLAGEPGVGKTRIVQELVIYAREAGVRALWGWCYENEGVPPYWPWVQLIRSYVEREDPDRLRIEMGVGASDIAQVVPEIRNTLPYLETAAQQSPEQDRFRLFHSMATFLKNSARSRPIMLVLDDLHWADESSLMLLRFLARDLSDCNLLVVGCYRDMELARQHPLVEALADLAPRSEFRRLSLRGLDQNDARMFIEENTGIRPSQDLVTAVHTRTEGNPFFLKEVVQLLAETGDLRPNTRGISIPTAVREAIGQRLNRRSHRCNQVLSNACVIGRDFHVSVLQKLVEGWSEDDLLDALDEALTAGVIEEAGNQPGGYRFSHALIQETLASELSSVRRARMHARIGQVLEELYESDVRSHAAELAHHWGEGSMAVSHQKFVYYSSLAGNQALELYGYEDALSHFQRGLNANGYDTRGELRAQLLYGLGRSQGAVGQVHDAWTNLNRAFDIYLHVGDVDWAVAVAEYPLFYVTGVPDVSRMVYQALSLVPAGSREAGRLLARQGLLVNFESGDYDKAQGALDTALAIAQQDGDLPLEIQSLANSADVAWYHTRWNEVVTKSVRSIELARRLGDLHAEVWPHMLAGTASYMLGRLEQADYHGDAMLECAERIRNRGFLANAYVLKSYKPQVVGLWHEAREFSDRGLDMDPDMARLLGRRVILEYEAGDYEAGDNYLNRLLAIMRRTPPGACGEYAIVASVVPLTAYIANDLRRFDLATEAAEVVFASPSGSSMRLVATMGLGLISVQESDSASAEQHYNFLVPHAGTFIDVSGVSVDRLLGLLAGTIGTPDQAAVHFEDSLTFCRNAGYRPELGWTCCDYAGTLLQRNDLVERTKAIALLEESLAIAKDLSMRPLAERASEKLAAVQAAPTLISGYPDGLSRREVEVLRLVALGRSNREISQELIISHSTVAHHMTNILNKIRAANRTEAAAYATRHGLSQSDTGDSADVN